MLWVLLIKKLFTIAFIIVYVQYKGDLENWANISPGDSQGRNEIIDTVICNANIVTFINIDSQNLIKMLSTTGIHIDLCLWPIGLSHKIDIDVIFVNCYYLIKSCRFQMIYKCKIVNEFDSHARL